MRWLEGWVLVMVKCAMSQVQHSGCCCTSCQGALFAFQMDGSKLAQFSGVVVQLISEFAMSCSNNSSPCLKVCLMANKQKR